MVLKIKMGSKFSNIIILSMKQVDLKLLLSILQSWRSTGCKQDLELARQNQTLLVVVQVILLCILSFVWPANFVCLLCLNQLQLRHILQHKFVALGVLIFLNSKDSQAAIETSKGKHQLCYIYSIHSSRLLYLLQLFYNCRQFFGVASLGKQSSRVLRSVTNRLTWRSCNIVLMHCLIWITSCQA
mgnify:CR=1 FL=1